jgi:hypothetical protein
MKSKQVLALFAFLILSMINLMMAVEEKKDLATGEGLMVLQSDGQKDEFLRFEPRYGYAYAKETNGKKQLWLLMTNQDAANLDWTTAKDRVQALREWCESNKTPFVLVELDDAGVPQLVTQCPGNGVLAVEMISTINGFPSVQISYEINDGKRLRGHLQGGNGTCGEMTYCEQTKDYYFDVTLNK